MKKIFNHTKRPREPWNGYEQDADWDGEYEDSNMQEAYSEEGYYEDEETYGDSRDYADDINYGESMGDTEEGAYESGQAYEDGVNYAEDMEYAGGTYEEETAYAPEGDYEDEAAYGNGASYEDGVNYAEDMEYAEEAYEEETAYAPEGDYEDEESYGNDAFYEDGVIYAEDEEIYGDEEAYGNGASYEDGITYGDGMEYEDGAYEDGIYDMDNGRYEESYGAASGGKRNFFGAVWDKFLDMSGFDRIITVTGAAVLVLAVVTAGVYFSASLIEKQVSEFVTVGKQLDGIDTIGEQGLVVLTDKRLAKMAAATVVEEEEQGRKEYNETEYNKSVTVSLETTSIMKDLKIKFTNRDTGKLIANVPFAVTITKPDGKSEIWSDDDMDGIIYKKDIAAGNYKVAVSALEGDKYKDYTVPGTNKSVEVKKDITYKKVDVTNEIKKESEINIAKEEAKKTQLAVESSLQDTVSWVESTATASTYREVSKSTIPDPRTLAKSGEFMRLTASGNDAISLSQTEVTVNAGSTVSVSAIIVDNSGGDAFRASTSNGDVATTYTSGNTVYITGVEPGTAVITVVHPNDNLTACCIVTVLPANTITLDKGEVAVVPGGTSTIQATLDSSKVIQPGNVVSSNTGVATVSVSGNTITVTGVSVGSATITVTHPNDSSKAAACRVTVSSSLNISLDKGSTTIFSGGTAIINAVLNDSRTIKAENVVSSNTDVAKVSVSGNQITITGVAAGSATITVTHPDDRSKAAACTVTVKDGNGLLKDKDGNQVYILDGENNYKEAKYTDYDAIQQDKYKVFIRGDVKYTGWQTLNGKVYFFNANGDKVTGEQVIQGAKYHFASDGSLVTDSGTMGIDVSKFNGSIDWNAVKNSGVSYVIIRVGYRGYTQGSLVDDPKFAANIKGATAAGLKVGVYFFTQAVDEVEAVEEASMVLERIKGHTISYPVFLDVEPSGGKGRADSLSKETRTAVCKAFCETIQNAGYTAGIYANKTWLTEKIDASALSAYKIWLAQYAATPTYKGRYDLWQYKSTGRISGISGNVDMNISYLGY